MSAARARVLMVVVVLLTVIFLLRAVQWQVLEAGDLRRYARRRSIVTHYLPAGRGRIYDRNGVLLAADKLTYDLAVVFAHCRFEGFDAGWYRRSLSRCYTDLKDPFLPESSRRELRARIRRLKRNIRALVASSPTVRRVAALIGADPALLSSSLSKALVNVSRGWEYPWKPVVVARDVDRRRALSFFADPALSRGWELVPSHRRVYPWGEMLFHVLGYMKELSPQEHELLLKNGLIPGFLKLGKVDYDYLVRTGTLLDEKVGRAGVERTFEEVLRGRTGLRRIFRSADDSERILEEIPPKNGRNLHLSIDLRFQKAAWDALSAGGWKGAVVVMSAVTGEILAMASAPSVDPRLLMGRLTPAQAQAVYSSPDAPLINRAVQGQYPLGSVFKVVMAVTGLEEGAITPETRFHCAGTLPAGDRVFRCYHGTAHGDVNVSDALKVSCNIFFYKLSELMPPARMTAWAHKFGLGERTGVELPPMTEKRGHIPSASGRRWTTGRRYLFAIGQGETLVTPLQAAVLMAVVANGGYRVRPTLLKVRTHPNRVALDIDEKTLSVVRRGLWRVVNEPGGTAHSSRPSGLSFTWAGKTGSAEVSKREPTHSWFVCYAPADEPRYVVSVICEKAGTGGSVAAPIASSVLQAIFSLPDVGKEGREGR